MPESASRGVSALGGVCSMGVSAPGGLLLQGVSALGGCLHQGGDILLEHIFLDRMSMDLFSEIHTKSRSTQAYHVDAFWVIICSSFMLDGILQHPKSEYSLRLCSVSSTSVLCFQYDIRALLFAVFIPRKSSGNIHSTRC